ncbi:DUF1800 family protein [bacterium]|nr:DUF1800 family protein [bacterium]
MRGHGLGSLPLAVVASVVLAGPAAAATLRIVPSAGSLVAGTSRRFTASLNNVPTARVTWAVNGIAGGSPTVGTIDRNGLYTAPAPPPDGFVVTIGATTSSDPVVTASIALTVRHPTPLLSGITPSAPPLGPFALEVRGSGFAPGATVLWNGTALATSFASSTLLRATGSADTAGSARIAVANPGPGALSATRYVSVRPAPTRTATLRPTATAPPATSTRTPTQRPTETRTPTPLPSPPATATRPPTAVPTATATAMPSSTTTAPPSSTMRPTETRTMAPTMTATMLVATATATPTPRGSETRTPTGTGQPTRTATAARTPTGGTAAPSLSVSVAPASVTVLAGATQQFQATVSGSANQAVTWSVSAIGGGEAAVGTIDASGLYTAPTTVPAGGSVTVRAASAANPAAVGSATVLVRDPLAITYGRLLDQTSFGPTQASMARLAQIGIPAYLSEQFAMAESPWPSVSTTDRSLVVDAFFNNALKGQDQLRQRVIFALSEIIVEASNKNTNNEDIIPWLQLLSRNAFGNYRTLLREITLDASMGKFLDLANSGFFGGAPNENFPREVMQLFSIGLYRLNQDGSLQRDGQGLPLATYTQADVQQLAKALTGWTYGNASGTPPAYANSNYYPGPMLPVEKYHDKSAKTLLGQALPANQTATQDLDAAIDVIVQHPNVGPFVATRLIRALVTSNPSPAYISRVAAAFNGPPRGDMQATLRAVLLDAEARDDTPPATFGRLRTPMQHTIALARALNLDLGQPSQFAYLFYDMNEGLLDAPSVFGHYSPTYRLPVSGLFGPEFQIYSASGAVNRGNLFYLFLYSPWPINPALQPLVAVAGNTTALVDAVDQTLLYGRMLPATRAALLTALPQMPDNNARVLTAVYLTAMAGESLVQR